jgi:HPr kinase/phosphorylase
MAVDPRFRTAPRRPAAIPVLDPEGLERLANRPRHLRKTLLQSLVRSGAPCLLLAPALTIPPFLGRLSRRFRLPVLASSLDPRHLESRLTGLIREYRDGMTRVHGCLAVTAGRGILITGESGTGKTTAALRLAGEPGGAWVADDMVDLVRRDGTLRGRAPARISGLVAVPGRGITRAAGLFHSSRILPEAEVDGVARLVTRTEEGIIGGPGMAESGTTCRILGLERPCRVFRVDEGEPVERRIAAWATSLCSGRMEP